jgi:hypothetical protein
LWFVGDYASYSAGLAEITRKTAEVFQKTGLDYGILYEAERNAGDPGPVLAHVAGIEWTYPRLIGVAEEQRNAKQTAEQPPEKPNRPAQGGIGSYNDRTVERYAATSVAELIDIFDENRATLIAAVEAADDDLFSIPIRSSGGIPGPLGTVLNYVAVLHVNGHVSDIVAAAGD